MAFKKGGLGKGLDAIFLENAAEDNSNTVTLKISDIEPNRQQPRRDFDEKTLAELADSIAQHGVLQPLLVRPVAGGGYQIVAGERRWRACRMAGISEVPAMIRDLSDCEVMELALIENLQREDLSPIEEARGYKTLIENYNFTQDEISKSVGKSRPSITNVMRLLNLPENVIDMVNSGEISAGHGRALLSFIDEEDMKMAADLVKEKGISVRELEKLAKKVNSQKYELENEKGVYKKRNTFFDEVEISLNELLNRKVKILNSKADDEKGVLEIDFYSKEDLADIVKKLDK